MLISIPGEPLRKILRHGDKRIEEANASQYNTVSSHPGKQAAQVSCSCFKLMPFSCTQSHTGSFFPLLRVFHVATHVHDTRFKESS